MSETTELHSSIVALVSLAAAIAARHPDMGLCQLDRLRQAGVPEAHIRTVIEIARHLRDEAAEKLDATFDEQAGLGEAAPATPPARSANERLGEIAVTSGEACCTPTPGGQSCC